MILILKIHALTHKLIVFESYQNFKAKQTNNRDRQTPRSLFDTLVLYCCVLFFSFFVCLFVFFLFLCRSDFKRKKKYFLRKISLLFVDGNSASNVLICACDINLRGKKTRYLTVTRTFLLNLFWRPEQRFAFSRLYREIRSDQQTNKDARTN